MSVARSGLSVSEWWASERPLIAAVFPQRCDEVVARTAAGMNRAAAAGDLATLSDAAAFCARAYTTRGEPETAARLLHELLERDGERFSAVERAALTASLAFAYEALGKYAEALDLLQEAHAAYSAADDRRGIAMTRLSMGVIHSRCRDHAIGLGHYAVALELFEALGEASGIVRVLNNVGLNQRNLGLHGESLATFDRAIGVATAAQLDSLIPTIAGNRGRTLMAMGRLDEAEAGFERHAQGMGGNAWRQSFLDAQLGLAEVAHVRGQHRTVIAKLEALIPELQRSAMLDAEVTAWTLMAEAKETEGDAVGALAAYKQLRERERLWLDQRANTRLRASTLMTDLEAARREAREEQRLRDELARAHASLAIEAAERRARADELYRQSREDGLTGLPNRRDFMERLTEECRRAGRFEQTLCVVMIDIDHFKRVNDRYGHATGDRVLMEVAQRLRVAVRAGDIIARLGGEEFAALLPQTEAAAARALCERLRAAVPASPVAMGGDLQNVTISIGVTAYVPPEAADAALARADERLYAAKAAGRDCVAGDAAD